MIATCSIYTLCNILRNLHCHTVDCYVKFNCFTFRDSGPDETKIKGYLPKDKQFLYTKNGMP